MHYLLLHLKLVKTTTPIIHCRYRGIIGCDRQRVLSNCCFRNNNYFSTFSRKSYTTKRWLVCVFVRNRKSYTQKRKIGKTIRKITTYCTHIVRSFFLYSSLQYRSSLHTRQSNFSVFTFVVSHTFRPKTYFSFSKRLCADAKTYNYSCRYIFVTT